MMQLLPKILSSNDDRRKAQKYNEVLRYEARMGGELFGPVPAGHRREFFCLDRYTWVWHEEWTDQSGKPQAVTTRYNIRPDQVLKTQNDQPARPVSKDELKNLYRAIKLYGERMPQELHRVVGSA